MWIAGDTRDSLSTSLAGDSLPYGTPITHVLSGILA